MFKDVREGVACRFRITQAPLGRRVHKQEVTPRDRAEVEKRTP